MVAPAEVPFVYGFAAALAIGSAVLLFVPVFRYLHDAAASRSLLWVALIGLLGVCIAAVYAITTASSDSAGFLPIAAVTIVLRLSSPTLLYRGIRDRLDTNRAWPAARLLLALTFVGFACLLAYGLFHQLIGQPLPPPIALSEQFAMAAGASFLILRTAYRFRPRFSAELWSFWLSATALAVAFIVIAPYAFPAFAIAYVGAGILGWIVGVVVLRAAD
jgi:hypothetical protein